MKRLEILTATAISIAALTTSAAARDLTVVSWGGSYQEAQRNAYFDTYTSETGNNLIDEAYNGELAKLKAMVDGNNITWDVIQMEAPELERSCDEDLIERIDWDKLGGKDKFLPSAIVGDCGVGANVWATVLAYNADVMGAEGPTSWADFWNVEKFPGKRALRKSPKFTLEIALIADGVPNDEIYDVLSTREGIERAFAKLDEIKDDIQWWESGAQPMQWLAAGDVVMTSAYNGRVSTAKAEGHGFTTVWNGQVASVDGWVIVKGTENLEAAYEFLRVASVPENQAEMFTESPYGPTVHGAIEKMDPAIQKELPNYPPNMQNVLLQDTIFWIENGEELNQRFNNWASR